MCRFKVELCNSEGSACSNFFRLKLDTKSLEPSSVRCKQTLRAVEEILMDFYKYSIYINEDKWKINEVTLLYWKILTVFYKSKDTIP